MSETIDPTSIRLCTWCMGSGRETRAYRGTCPMCHGTGWVRFRPLPSDPTGMMGRWDPADPPEEYRVAYIGDCRLTGPEHCHFNDDALLQEGLAEAERQDLIGPEWPQSTADMIRIGMWGPRHS